MAKTVMGVFERREQAERAAGDLRAHGFTERQVSIVGRKDGADGGAEGPDLGRGTTWGAGIGAAAGLLATAGALTIPGIGPLVAMGPLATALGGAATGGVAGALVDWGIPQERGRQVEEEIRQGRFLALVEADGKADQAADVLRRNGARAVERYDRPPGAQAGR